MNKNLYQSSLKLPVEKLYQRCDLSQLAFELTTELEDNHEHLGQDRAMDALHFGIGMKHDGYNLYVLGSTGLGKNTAVKKILEKEALTADTPADWCYINNFFEPDKPDTLRLPAGLGRQLQQDMRQVVEDVLVAIPAAFDSEDYVNRAQSIQRKFKQLEVDAFKRLSDKADDNSITLIRTASGYSLNPMKEGKAISSEEFDQLESGERESIRRIIEELEAELIETIKKIPAWQKENRAELKQLSLETAELVVRHSVAELASKYSELPDVTRFIDRVRQDITENVDDILKYSEGIDSGNNNRLSIQSAFPRYQVNVLVDNGQTQGAPVIYEDNPSYLRLIGHIEHKAHYGTLFTDFTLIKAGALHRANGGYLILDAGKLLMSPFSWEGLKRAIHAHELSMESLEQMLSLASTTTLQPQPVPIDVKILLTGSRQLYYLLKQFDPEFGQLFKVAADFAEDIDRSEDNSKLYARLIAGLQRRNGLNAFNKAAVERVIEHGSRLMEDSEKISLHMGGLLDLLKEGDYWARASDQSVVTREHIQQAIDSRRYQLDQIRERVHEQVIRGDYLLDTEGEKVAQINGLSLTQLGDYIFGSPVRITATARLGLGKVIDIEREANLGGAIHSKGVMILSSYLANRYAKDQPMSLSASLVFEQSYGMIEGDSASAAELCSLLSALSELPIKQSFSVTGSVNQYGEIQAIGGVNEKIEGFFDICNARRLSGEQAVVIPASNVKHRMLRADVCRSVEQGRFAIYAVSSIDQMMELLTGRPAGVAGQNGHYPPGSLHYLVQARIDKLNRLRHQFSENAGKTAKKFRRKIG